ncbi:MAG: phosphatidylglycerophosphatase A [Gammaproteobacteria bacterium]|nr:phosphatidylglycerophosphatase A [Gammaproteobacteria bacterium]NNJ95659.1 phosphatidylglycerophosphatase A [Gammaproteobacteria bacterium]
MNTIEYSQLKNPVVLIAVGFGSGLAPKAPGTAGTVVAVPLYLLMQSLPLVSYLLITTCLFIAGIWICAYTAEKLGVHDHPSIVIDEIVGYLITMVAAPEGWLAVAIGFILFRLLDALKPWPISWFDRSVNGGLGIMLDDVVAGIIAMAIIQGLVYTQILSCETFLAFC